MPTPVKITPVDVNSFSDADLVERLGAAHKFSLQELLTHVRAFERRDNGEIEFSEEMAGQHQTYVDMASAVLAITDGPEYLAHAKSTVIEMWRSASRKKSTGFTSHAHVAESDPSKATREQNLEKILKLRQILHTNYEQAFINIEKADNGDVEVTPGQANAWSAEANFAAMLIPKVTDDADFLFNWRKQLIHTHRSADRLDEDDFL